MARGRLLSKSLSTSHRFELARQRGGRLGEFCQVLFPLLNAHADDFGRLAGDAFTVKALVLPTSPRKEADFDAALITLADVGLIGRAEVGGRWIIQVIGFDGHQPGLHKRTESQYPEIPKENTQPSEPPGTSGKVPEIPASRAGAELNRTELNRTEQNRRTRKDRSSAGADSEGFEDFYQAYPRKKAPKDALKAWVSLRPSVELRACIMAAVEAQRAELLARDPLRVPYPATWLRGEQWKNEPDQPPAAATGGRRIALQAPTYDANWCQHEPRCTSRDWHAILTGREQVAQ